MRNQTIFHKIMIILFCSVMIIGFVLGLAFFLRPERSDSENRELTKFPSFTFTTFLSGEYTEQISTWFADTFPFREGLIAANDFVMSLKGFGDEQFQLNVPQQTPNDAPGTGSDINQGETLGGYFVTGDVGYELLHKNDTVSSNYASLINTVADQLDGKATLYTIVVPLAYSYNDAVLNKVKGAGAIDPKDAIDGIYASVSHGNAVKVDAYSALGAHKDEYLYFRTDHHWTARGAYYAYTAYCEEAGLEAHPLSYYKEYKFEGFLGTIYNASKAQKMQKNPDTVYAYAPRGTNTLYVHPKDEDIIKFSNSIVRTNTDTAYNASAKYNCFLTSDNPAETEKSFYISIENPQITDGSAVVLVKESFGNCFAPFLVDHYQYVYVIDYRYFEDNLVSFVEEHNVKQVIFLNNVMATHTQTRVEKMKGLID